jgi:hypothetical protein
MEKVDRTNPCYAQHLVGCLFVSSRPIRANPCQAFEKCLQNNDSDLARCQWAMDLFKECKVLTMQSFEALQC